jgi:microcystin-dependent protein
MGQPYVGEIRMFAGNFAPAGWMFCSGQLLPISENETLFQLIGTTYGGDGQSTFALPNLMSRVPIHQGTGSAGGTYVLAQTGGVEEVTLNVQQIPNHTHALLANGSSATSSNPGQNVFGNVSGFDAYFDGLNFDSPAFLNTSAVAPIGGSQPHNNMQPYLCINFIISLFGIFPTLN